MTPDDVLAALTDLLCRLCEQDRLTLTPETRLYDIPNIDSLRLLQATALLEEQFRVEIDVVALEDLHRVSDVLALIGNAAPPYRWLSFPQSSPHHPDNPRRMLDTLCQQIDTRPNAPACADGTNELTFAAFGRAIGHLAQAMGPLDPGPIAIVLPNGVGPVIASFACLAAGRLSVPIEPGPSLREKLRQSGAVAVVAAAGVTADRPTIPIEAAFQDGASPIENPLDLDAPAFLHATSGSSGEPKFLVHSQRSLLHRFCSLADACRLGPVDRLLSFGHAPGIWTWCVPLTGCAVTLLPAEAGYRRVLATLTETPITILRATPSLLRSLLTLPAAAEALGRVRLIYLYGEAVLRADIETLTDKLPHCQLLNAYGATEAGGLHWFARRGDDHDPIRVAAGLPWPQTDVALLGPDNELVLRTPAAALGEWHNGRLIPGPFRPDPTDPTRRIWHSGDLARQAPDGAIVVLGRRDRMVKINGIRVEPATVEAVLRAMPGVAEAVALARQHADGRVQLAAFIVTAPDRTDAIRDALIEALPIHLQPNPLTVVPGLPRLPSGKLDERSLWDTLGG